MSSLSRIFMCLLIITAIALTPNMQTPLHAQGKLSIIRDTEIENILKKWLEPLKKANNMQGNKINLILVESNQLNAFVAGGANIFFYTGLIQKTKNPEELIGVMAHEMGHIAGGHLISMGTLAERTSYETILGMVVGIGAAILTGDGRAAQAVSGTISGIAQTRFLKHTRTNESAADQAAITALDKAGISSEGLISFLKILESEEYLPASKQSEYVRTHPLTSNRIQALKRRTDTSPNTGKKLPAQWYEDHKRMNAKLLSYLTPTQVAWFYSDHDTSIPARYARAIAAYKQNNVEHALNSIDELLKSEPNNPYFHELKGQMLVEFGHVRKAVSYYKTALKYLPNAGLIHIAYAHALIESNPTQAQLKEAINHLQIAAQTEKRSHRIHRLSAIAHGKLGHDIEAKIHLAEEAVLQRRLPYAKQLATYSKDKSKPNSSNWIKAQDILSYLDLLKKRQSR